MDLLLRLFAIAATAVFLLAVLLVLFTFRRARRVTTVGLLLPVGMSLAVLFLYCAILGATPSAAWLMVGLGAGALVGLLWARTQRLFRGGDGAVRSRANLWYLAVWAAVLALNQLVAVVGGRSSRVLVGLLVLSTGIALGNGLVLLRRLRALRAAAALAFAVAVAGSTAGADDVLLLLPREFDSRPVGGSSRYGSKVYQITPKDVADNPAYRFRGEEVTYEKHDVFHHDTGGCWVDVEVHEELRATLHRGNLQGRWVMRARNFYRSCKDRDDAEYMRSKDEGIVTGRAEADGRLTVAIESADREIIDRKLEWVKRGQDHHLVAYDQWTKRNQHQDPFSIRLEFQLPVGELQSSQKLSPRPTPIPVRVPPAGGVKARRDRVGSDEAVASSGPEGERRTARAGEDAAAKAQPGETDEASDSRVTGEKPGGGEVATGDGEGETGDGKRGDPGGQPVPAAAAAKAAAGAAAVSLLGALWMLVSTGVRPSDLLSPPPAMDAEAPPLDLPPDEPPIVHDDGDVHPETGDRWSSFDRGWIGADEYARREGADQAEVARAQRASLHEAQRQSARDAEALRASEARQREAAAAQASAAREFELEASFRPQRIEPYEPAWSDRVTSGLELGEKVADNLVSVLGELTGEAGQVGGRIYTVTKETLKGTSEGVAAYARGQQGVLAEKGSAWVIAERAGIGLAKGGAKVGLDYAAAKVLDAAAKLGGRKIPELPDLRGAAVGDAVGQVASGAAEGAARRAFGIAVGKTAGSQAVQEPANMAVEAVTGEEL